MVDVDERLQHCTDIVRPIVSRKKVCFSFAAYARAVIRHLAHECHISIAKGLSEEEFVKVENSFGFTFPPDLKSILQEGLPLGPAFPNWRSGSEQELRKMIDLPLCWKKWAPLLQFSLHKAPMLVPIYSHYYIPSLPNLAGNPVFFVSQKNIFCCGFDIADFFQKVAFLPQHGTELDSLTTLPQTVVKVDVNNHTMAEVEHLCSLERAFLRPVLAQFTIAAPPWAAKTARRIDFWSDLIIEWQERMKDMHQEGCMEEDAKASELEGREEEGGEFFALEGDILWSKNWLNVYIEKLGKWLRNGGWKEREVIDMMEGRSGVREMNGDGAMVVNVNEVSKFLRSGGWSIKDVAEMLSIEGYYVKEWQERKDKKGGGRNSMGINIIKAGSLADYFTRT